MKAPNRFRIRVGFMASDDSYGVNGSYLFPNPFTKNGKPVIRVIASDGQGWEHVSVSLEFRCPIWEEMCWVKNLFWDETETVIQFHPAKKFYKNIHPFCLHLWRRSGENFELPEQLLV